MRLLVSIIPAHIKTPCELPRKTRYASKCSNNARYAWLSTHGTPQIAVCWSHFASGYLIASQLISNQVAKISVRKTGDCKVSGRSRRGSSRKTMPSAAATYDIPRSQSVWTVSGGLPTLGKRH